ncbi:MAG TPA: iron chelate uptake ABC transporter family permease subunit [Acidimicrobiales bacterium]|nr:iron chelate uptake ABC transporter family permease subunit [Acidimicrobiales bacterium]
MKLRWGRGAGLVVAAGALALVALSSVAFGSKPLGFGTVVDALLHFDGSNDHLVVRSLRVPRTLIGIGVGAALGLAGAVMQGVTRNPLADPGILGIEAGAGLGVVVAIHTFSVGSLSTYVWFAFLGAGVAAVVVYLLGSAGRGGATPVKLALAGAALTALLSSITSAILLLDVTSLDQYRFWVVGSIAGRDGEVLRQVLPYLLVGAVLAFASARLLNTLALGDDVARSLGARVRLGRAVAALAVILLCGAATAAAGPIGFVGLTVPHVARAITGPDYRWILPWSLLLGPTLLLSADVLGRVLARPGELQVGIVTAVIGTPFFVALVRRRNLAAL